MYVIKAVARAQSWIEQTLQKKKTEHPTLLGSGVIVKPRYSLQLVQGHGVTSRPSSQAADCSHTQPVYLCETVRTTGSQ